MTLIFISRKTLLCIWGWRGGLNFQLLSEGGVGLPPNGGRMWVHQVSGTSAWECRGGIFNPFRLWVASNFWRLWGRQNTHVHAKFRADELETAHNLNPLSPNMHMLILLAVLYIFLMLVVGRISCMDHFLYSFDLYIWSNGDIVRRN